MNKKRLLSLALIAITTIWYGSQTAQASDKVVLQFANVANQSGKEAGSLLKKLVVEKTNGTLDINLYNDNSYGDDRVATESVILGEIDMVNTPPTPIAGMIPNLFLYDAPFLFDSSEEAFRWFDSETGQKINKQVASKGLKLLGVWQNGFRMYTNDKVKVVLPKDIKKQKLRTMENPIQLAMWKTWGANPTPMAFTEVLAALQQGTIDAQENPLALIDSNHFYEIQKYITLTGHVYGPHFVMINQAKFDALSKEHQTALLEAMEEATKLQRARAVEIDNQLVEKFKKTGNVVIDLTPEDKKVWRDMAIEGGVYDLVKEKMDNPEILDLVLSKKY